MEGKGWGEGKTINVVLFGKNEGGKGEEMLCYIWIDGRGMKGSKF